MTEYFPKIEIPKVNATPAEASAVAALAANDIPSRILAAEQGPMRLMLDVDFGQDADDVGAMALAHHLADLGECQIIAMANSFGDVAGCAGMSAINSFYGRPDIPVGLGGTIPSDDNYLTQGALFPNRIGSSVTPPTAVSVYRRALASSPDASVVWYVQGPMTILNAVYNSAADSISSLTGAQLMAQKLSRLVVLGGYYPGGGSEYDFYSDAASSQVINQLVGFPVIFQGFECGDGVQTSSTQPAYSPVRVCYDAFFEALGGTTRSSWGAVGVLYCVRGLVGNVTLSDPGTCSVDVAGANTWTAGASGAHRYLVQAASDVALAATIQALQDAAPLATEPATQGRIKLGLETYSHAAWPTTATRNNFTGAIGYGFTLSSARTATRLGRLYVAGNTGNHQIKLWRTSDQYLMASGVISATSPSDANGYKWVMVAPVALAAGVEYRIALDELNAGDTFKDDWAPSLSAVVSITTTGAYNTTPGAYLSQGPNSLAAGHVWNTAAVAFDIP